MNERFIIDHYDAQYVTDSLSDVFIEIYKLISQNDVIKHLRVKNLASNKYDTYHVYRIGSNCYIDSKIKSYYESLILLPNDKHLFFFKLINGKNDFGMCNSMVISDILPKGVEINQYTIQYYYLLNNTEKILSKSEFEELFS